MRRRAEGRWNKSGKGRDEDINKKREKIARMAVKGIKKDEDYESDKLQRKIEKVPIKSHRD